MAADITLGSAPKRLNVVLAPGADFVSGLRRSDAADWDAGTVLELEFDTGDTWAATITADVAQWNEDAAVVDTLIAATPGTAKLWYVNGALKLLWAQGAVIVQ